MHFSVRIWVESVSYRLQFIGLAILSSWRANKEIPHLFAHPPSSINGPVFDQRSGVYLTVLLNRL